LKGLLLLATLCEGLKGTALVISKLKQKPLETTAASVSGGAEEEVITALDLLLMQRGLII
jgi:hypothetical protein